MITAKEFIQQQIDGVKADNLSYEFFLKTCSPKGSTEILETLLNAYALIKCRETIDNTDRRVEYISDSEELYEAFIPADLQTTKNIENAN